MFKRFILLVFISVFVVQIKAASFGGGSIIGAIAALRRDITPVSGGADCDRQQRINDACFVLAKKAVEERNDAFCKLIELQARLTDLESEEAKRMAILKKTAIPIEESVAGAAQARGAAAAARQAAAIKTVREEASARAAYLTEIKATARRNARNKNTAKSSEAAASALESAKSHHRIFRYQTR